MTKRVILQGMAVVIGHWFLIPTPPALANSVKTNAGADQFGPLLESLFKSKEASELQIWLLVFSTKGCPWCRWLRSHQLPSVPEAYEGIPIRVREVMMDQDLPLRDFAGKQTTHRQFAQSLNIRMSPTVVIFDQTGKRLVDPLIGVASQDFYSHSLESLWKEAIKKIK